MEKNIDLISNLTIGRGALILAMSCNREEEEIIKAILRKKGFRCAATEIGGITQKEDAHSKLIGNIMSAALNEKVIEKTTREMHAVVHASLEAEEGVIIYPVSASVLFKVAIVRNAEWLCVTIYGQSGFHKLTGHERCGLGMMHL